MDFLNKACEGYPHLRVKIAVDCVEKGYATHEQVSDFLGLNIECWKLFYANYQEGDVQRVPKDVRNLVPTRDLRFLSGFTDEQLGLIERALEVPFLFGDGFDDTHPLLQELRVLLSFGIMLVSRDRKSVV